MDPVYCCVQGNCSFLSWSVSSFISELVSLPAAYIRLPSESIQDFPEKRSGEVNGHKRRGLGGRVIGTIYLIVIEDLNFFFF